MPVLSISGHMRLAPKLENSHHWSAGLGFTIDSRHGQPATEKEAAIAPTARAARAVLGRFAGLFPRGEAGAVDGLSSADRGVTSANITYERPTGHSRARFGG